MMTGVNARYTCGGVGSPSRLVTVDGNKTDHEARQNEKDRYGFGPVCGKPPRQGGEKNTPSVTKHHSNCRGEAQNLEVY